MALGPATRRQPSEELSTALGLFLLTLLAFAVFSWTAKGFSSPYNLYALTRTAALNVLLGLAMMVVIATGGLDLSSGRSASHRRCSLVNEINVSDLVVAVTGVRPRSQAPIHTSRATSE